MSKKEILAAFENVINQLVDVLDKQTTLNAYVKVEAKIEAYRDAATLISRALPDEEEAPADAPVEPNTEEIKVTDAAPKKATK